MSIPSDETNPPQMPPFPACGTGFSNYRYISPLAESKFQKKPDDIQAVLFGSANTTHSNQAGVIYENDVCFQFVTEMIAFLDRDADGELDYEDTVQFRYDVKIFVSKDATYLKDAFDKTQPDEDDVCFFLEDNGTDFLSDRKAYIKIGSDFRNDLEKRNIIGTIETNKTFISRYTTYNGRWQTFPLDFSREEIRELIRTGQISNPGMSILIGLYQALNIQNIILAPVYSVLAEALLGITSLAREYIEFSEDSWNPYAGGKKNVNFEPVLFGNVDALREMGKDGVSKAVSMIQTGLKAQVSVLKSKLSTLINPTAAGYIGSPQLTAFFETCFSFIENCLDYLFYGLDSIVNFLYYLGDKWLNVCNAFYCGLWNSVVEIVLGTIDLIGYLFKFMAASGGAQANAQTLIPEALEIADEFIQTIMNKGIWSWIGDVFRKLLDKVPTFNLYALTNSISIEQVAYFIGGIAGFIVELIIDEFLSGGIKGVLDLFNKFGALSKAVREKITVVVSKITKGAAAASVEAVMYAIKYFTELLKKGKEEVLKWIDEFFELMEDVAVLASDIIERIRELFKLTPDEVKVFEDAGLSFVKFEETGKKVSCNLCKIKY